MWKRRDEEPVPESRFNEVNHVGNGTMNLSLCPKIKNLLQGHNKADYFHKEDDLTCQNKIKIAIKTKANSGM